jgi:hypothetical protein
VAGEEQAQGVNDLYRYNFLKNHAMAVAAFNHCFNHFWGNRLLQSSFLIYIKTKVSKKLSKAPRASGSYPIYIL